MANFSLFISAPWHVFNDSSVSSATYDILDNITQAFPNDVAYALFYRRLDKANANPESIEFDGSESGSEMRMKRPRSDQNCSSRASSPIPDSIRRRIDQDNLAYKTEIARAASMPSSGQAYFSNTSFGGRTAPNGLSGMEGFGIGGSNPANFLGRKTGGYSDAKTLEGNDYVDPDME